MFDNLPFTELKNTFNNAIDSLISQNGLSVPCILHYDKNMIKRELCYNCLYDPISQRSANRHNGTGPIYFPRESMCPVCNGYGYIDNATQETIYLAVIFDSKYWLNWGSKTVNISDGMVQSLCKIDLLPKINNCSFMVIDNSISNYGGNQYTRAGQSEPAGLGNNRYIITMWQKL